MRCIIQFYRANLLHWLFCMQGTNFSFGYMLVVPSMDHDRTMVRSVLIHHTRISCLSSIHQLHIRKDLCMRIGSLSQFQCYHLFFRFQRSREGIHWMIQHLSLNHISNFRTCLLDMCSHETSNTSLLLCFEMFLVSLLCRCMLFILQRFQWQFNQSFLREFAYHFHFHQYS